MSKQFKGSLILLLTAFLWGLAFIAQSISIKTMDSFSILYLRSFIAVITLLPFFLVSRKKEKSKIKPKKIDLILGPLSCGLCLCFGSLFQQIGMETVSAGKSGFITSMYILLVPLFSLFLKKKCGINVYLSLPIAVIGLLLLSFDFSSGLSFTTGDLLILIGTIFFALQIIFISYYSKRLNHYYLSIGQLSTQGILMLIVRLILGFSFKEFTSMFTVESIFAILFLGVFSSAIAYTLQLVGQKDVDPTIASIILSLESVFSALSSVIIYQFYKFSDIDQNLSIEEICGCIVLFLAVILSQLPQSLFHYPRKYLRQINKKINELLNEKEQVIIAIDGNSCSGKTSLANYIYKKHKNDTYIFHIDDFYKMNNGEVDLNSIDGNINYDYLLNEVLPHLKEEEFIYKKFNPHKNEEINNIYKKKKIVIIEGSYSLNPKLGRYYDYSIFLKINDKKQLSYLKLRNPDNYEEFINKWVKLENNYNNYYKIEDISNIKEEI